MPSHAQVWPRPLKSILPRVFTLHVTKTGQAHYSLAGTQLCGQFGQELGRTAFFATWEPSSVAVATALLRISHETRVPVTFELLATFASFQLVDVEIILAPLATDETGHMRFIGAMHIANPQPLLYSGTVLSQRLIAMQIAQSEDVPDRILQPTVVWSKVDHAGWGKHFV